MNLFRVRNGNSTNGKRSNPLAPEILIIFKLSAASRRDASINVSATATTQQAVVITEEQRRKLIELREKLLVEASP